MIDTRAGASIISERRSGPPALNLRKRKLADVEWADSQPSQVSKRRQLEVTDLIEYLDSLRPAEIKQPPPPKKPHLKLRKCSSEDMIKFVIFLRYNSLTSDACVARSCREIFEITAGAAESQSLETIKMCSV
jgi:hypothetical protein